jgi:Phage terminase large subunit
VEASRAARTSRQIPSLPDWLDPELSKLGGVQNPIAPWRYRALPAQLAFHQDLTTRFKGYSGPIGSGKSYALAYEALLLSRLNPGLLGLIGAPTYTMLQDSTQRTLFEVLEAEEIPFTFNKQENRVRLSDNRSEIIFRSMENPERLRGPNLAWFALDELTYTREEAWTRMLGRLRHPEARRLCGLGVWTPKGYDWVFQRFIDKQSPDHHMVRASPQENVYLPADFYEQLKHSYSDPFYRQEALGEYLDMYGGNVYSEFGPENIEAVEYDPRLPLCWALDFNVNPLSSLICQITQERANTPDRRYGPDAVVRVIDEIVLPNSQTVSAAKEFIRRVEELDPPYGIRITIYGDASGNSLRTNATRTDYELISQVFQGRTRFRVDLRQNKSNPGVIDRVNTVNNRLKTIAGTRRILINPRCKELIKDLRHVVWKKDRYGNRVGQIEKADTERTHLSDALSYLVAQEFGLFGRIGEVSTPLYR